jgi:hypothetical protein
MHLQTAVEQSKGSKRFQGEKTEKSM